MNFNLVFESIPRNMLHGELFDIELPSLVGQLVRVKVEFGDDNQRAHLYLEVCSTDGVQLCGAVVSQWARKAGVLRLATEYIPVGTKVEFERKHILYVGS
ncbi:hypothetical protein OTK49_20775 [Vibrio coralliirubri]|uniref:hypothetical protein n=1 Tax=Vibrio coralliirubri TaxID=1516159 RepID=UPI0022837745|nr:hypothetical protein [Vibrio coralliirubri]MCY9864953.1 hypothetical protein [Vibrio coralliirubri]